MAGRAVIHTSVTIAKPAEQVFDYLADVSRHGEWSPKPYRVENLSGPVAVGTTFTSYGWIPGDKEHRNDVTVTTFDKPKKLVFSSAEKGEQFINTFTLTDNGGTTTVERDLDMPKPGGLTGLILPVAIATFVKPAVQKGMNQMKARVEAL